MNLRYYFRLTWAFIIKFKAIILGSVFFGVVLFLLLRMVLPQTMSGTVEKIGVVGRYTSSDLPPEILHLISDGLTSVDDTGKAIPSLAKSWEASDDGKTWKFILADDHVWQDGTKVTAKNIKYSFDDVTTETPDDKTIIFKLVEPFAPFPIAVSKPTFKKGLLGTGKWRVHDISLNGNYVNEVTLISKDNSRKVIRFYPTDERAKLAYKLGTIDKIEGLISASPFEDWNNTTVTEDVNLKRFAAVFFNIDDPQVSDKSIRQGLAYAIDKKALGEPRATSNVWPGSWAYNPQTKRYDYDVERAKELLGDKGFSIKLATTPQLLDIAEKIAADWKKVGVDTTVQVASSIPSDYQAYLAIYDAPSDPDQYATWHSTQEETNITNYKNPRVDKLLEDGRQELDQEKRKAFYLDFQRFLLEDSPLIILNHPATFSIERK
jgi:peptide/nickel transport system substrate-binding protein